MKYKANELVFLVKQPTLCVIVISIDAIKLH